MFEASLRMRLFALAAGGFAAAISGSALCLELPAAGPAAGLVSPVLQAGSSAADRTKEMIQSLSSLIAKVSASRAEMEALLRSARQDQNTVEQYRRLGEQQKEFESQLRELCGVLGAIDPSEKVDQCAAGQSK
jgi:ABC-type transporter Mla subunit MlaD